ncbi:MAG: phytoene/squalene synthase family protein [Thermoanaerobaculales bacterium]
MNGGHALVRGIAHRRGANFSLGFRLLPPAKRRAVYAAYAACRIPDDIVDESLGADVIEVRRGLDAYEHEIGATFRGQPSTPAMRALCEALERYPIPKAALIGLINGCRMDLERSRYATFAELERYCELVAVTISDISLAIFGARRPDAHALGRHLAMALQLTNVCRDVGEDLGRGRIYLPLDELARFGVSEADLAERRTGGAAYGRLMAFECARARSHFEAANALPRAIHPDARIAVRVMGGVYRRVLDRVARDPVGAFRRRVELPRWQRAAAITAGLFGRPFV